MKVNRSTGRLSAIWITLLGSMVSYNLDIADGFLMTAKIDSGRHESYLYSIFDDDVETEKKKEGVDFENFNPLNYKSKKSNSAYSYLGTQISLRKTRMQELTNALINTLSDEELMHQILLEYKDFLLEPLEDPEAVLDPDSIYTPQMSRSERYEAYRSSMNKRVQGSKNVQVRFILQAMRDFVLSFESSC